MTFLTVIGVVVRFSFIVRMRALLFGQEGNFLADAGDEVFSRRIQFVLRLRAVLPSVNRMRVSGARDVGLRSGGSGLSDDRGLACRTKFRLHFFRSRHLSFGSSGAAVDERVNPVG